MREFGPDTEIAVPPDVVSRTVGGEVLILDLASGEYHGLDAVGSRIWELIRERRRFGSILEVILVEYEVGDERARADLARLLDEMAGKGLVRIAGEAP